MNTITLETYLLKLLIYWIKYHIQYLSRFYFILEIKTVLLKCIQYKI